MIKISRTVYVVLIGIGLLVGIVTAAKAQGCVTNVIMVNGKVMHCTTCYIAGGGSYTNCV